MKDYHKYLTKILSQIRGKYKKFEKPHKIRYLKINSCIGNDVLAYNPDFNLKYKVGKIAFEYIIFEFIDSQEETTTIADILRIILFENCRKAIFVSKTPEIKEITDNIINVVVSNLAEMCKKSKKDLLDIVSLHIPENLSGEKIEEAIIDEIKDLLPKKQKNNIKGQQKINPDFF